MKGLQAWIERYFPCSYERGGPVLVVIGIISALLYAYTTVAFEDELRGLPENMMVLTFLISAWGQRQVLKSDLMFKLLLLALLIPWILFGINALIDYETAIRYRSLNDLLKLFLFLPLAWWMGGSREGAIRVLIVAFLGLITAIALDPQLAYNLRVLLAGQRVDFNIHNAQHGALFFGLVLLFCLCGLSRRIQNGFVLNWTNTALILAALVGITGLVGTQTRAAFLGLVVTAFVALVLGVRQGNLFGQEHCFTKKGVLVLLLATGLLAWSANEVLHDRISQESASIEVLLTGNVHELPFTSIGIRVHSWAESLKWIAERPITGWGKEARRDVIRLAEHFPDGIKTVFGHLHNGYLEILLAFGFVGFAYVCVVWAVLFRRIKFAASNDLYAFALYGSIFFLVLNMFESLFFYWSGELAIALFMGAGYSQYLARSLEADPHKDR